MEQLLDYYVFILFLCTIGYLSIKKKNKVLDRHYNNQHGK